MARTGGGVDARASGTPRRSQALSGDSPSASRPATPRCRLGRTVARRSDADRRFGLAPCPLLAGVMAAVYVPPPRRLACSTASCARTSPTFSPLVDVRTDGPGLPSFVVAEFRKFLRCRVLAHGFALSARRLCVRMAGAVLVQGRGFRPSCGGRRMAERAAHLVDHVSHRTCRCGSGCSRSPIGSAIGSTTITGCVVRCWASSCGRCAREQVPVVLAKRSRLRRVNRSVVVGDVELPARAGVRASPGGVTSDSGRSVNFACLSRLRAHLTAGSLAENGERRPQAQSNPLAHWLLAKRREWCRVREASTRASMVPTPCDGGSISRRGHHDDHFFLPW